jgi:hypothetical protein
MRAPSPACGEGWGGQRERPVHADQAADQANGNAPEGAQAEARHVAQADDASALVGGRIDLDQGLRHGVEGQFRESRGKQEAERERIVVRQREDRKRGRRLCSLICPTCRIFRCRRDGG